MQTLGNLEVANNRMAGMRTNRAFNALPPLSAPAELPAACTYLKISRFFHGWPLVEHYRNRKQDSRFNA
jgi:hypothetical protein